MFYSLIALPPPGVKLPQSSSISTFRTPPASATPAATVVPKALTPKILGATADELSATQAKTFWEGGHRIKLHRTEEGQHLLSIRLNTAEALGVAGSFFVMVMVFLTIKKLKTQRHAKKKILFLEQREVMSFPKNEYISPTKMIKRISL